MQQLRRILGAAMKAGIVRREGSVLARSTFDQVAAEVGRVHRQLT